MWWKLPGSFWFSPRHNPIINNIVKNVVRTFCMMLRVSIEVRENFAVELFSVNFPVNAAVISYTLAMIPVKFNSN